jgi:hypothetical protein
MALKSTVSTSQQTLGLSFTRTNWVILNKQLLFSVWSKSKGKVHPITGHECPKGEKRYSSTLSLTSALDGVGSQHHAPADLPPLPIV